MPTTKKVTREEMVARHEDPDYDFFEGKGDDDIERVTVKGGSGRLPPISIRLSEPLLERLDRIAASEHRNRSNLIQHILWEYVMNRVR